MAITLLRKVQIGKETTAGTAVAATAIMRFADGVMKDDRVVNHVDENVGYLSRVNRTNTPKLGASMTMAGNATFEQLPYILEAGVKSVTPVVDSGTGASAYVYTYTFPTTAANTIKQYTVEGGDDQQAYEMEYAFVNHFSLSGTGGEAVKMSSDWIARQVTKASFTGSLSLPAVEDINFGKGKLYIDAVGGTIGTTQITDTWLSFNFDVNTGWRAIHTGDGNKYFSFNKCIGQEVALEVKFEHNASAVAQFDNWQAETAKQVRMLFQGSAFTTAGTTYTYKTAIFDYLMKVVDVSPLESDDGNDVVTVKLLGAYDGTAAKAGSIVVVNALSVLP